MTTATDPLANLTLRVRRPLDDRLADVERSLTRQLRDGGDTPTSKTELVELLLWELPPTPTEELRERLNAFRERAGRR